MQISDARFNSTLNCGQSYKHSKKSVGRDQWAKIDGLLGMIPSQYRTIQRRNKLITSIPQKVFHSEFIFTLKDIWLGHVKIIKPNLS